MKNILYTLALTGALCTLGSCDIERLPSTSMDASEVEADPVGHFDLLLNGAYSYTKDWSDPMHRCGEYAGDNIMIRGSSTDAFYEFISYSRTP
ncbi:MAG: RagB/SusD family nutrient uptake outer membrane protein, partial [Mediterranea sp.]|nr:RagB/SusD family nutrient uptake outer membrane protein [Mediterranea sp.]